MSKKDYPTIALGTWSWGKGMAGGDQVFGNNVGVNELRPVFDEAMKSGLNLWDSAVVYGMERWGVKIDSAELHKQSRSLKESLYLTEQDIFDFSGGPVNLQSPKQLAEMLFEQMALPYPNSKEFKNIVKAVSAARLAQVFSELEERGAENINLVTATHYAHLLPQALADARRRGLSIPVVYNTSGYERVEAIRELEGLVDIWLTDFKYASSRLGSELSHVPDYPQVAAAALAEMASQVERAGGQASRGDGTWTRGIIVRHLVLPGHADDSCRVLDQIWDAAGDVPVSVMNQYTPNAAMRAAGGLLSRAVTSQEYEQVLNHADDLGFTTMFWQEGGAVDESFTPPFDTTGVLVRADAGSGTLRAEKEDAS